MTEIRQAMSAGHSAPWPTELDRVLAGAVVRPTWGEASGPMDPVPKPLSSDAIAARGLLPAGDPNRPAAFDLTVRVRAVGNRPLAGGPVRRGQPAAVPLPGNRGSFPQLNTLPDQ